MIPAEQILGPHNVMPEIEPILEIIDPPKLAWVFLSQLWPFAHDSMRPIDKIKAGGAREVLSSAPSFGRTFS